MMSGTKLNAIVPTVCLAAALIFTGCDSRTKQSLCQDSQGGLEGITGVYDMHGRNTETFGIESQTIRIVPDEKSTTLKILSGNNDDTGVICNINGAYIVETKDESTGAYVHGRMFVSQVGLHVVPLLFDKLALDKAGIPNEIATVPDAVRNMIGQSLTMLVEQAMAMVSGVISPRDDEQQALFIDNTGVPAATLLQSSKPSSIGFNIYRR